MFKRIILVGSLTVLATCGQKQPDVSALDGTFVGGDETTAFIVRMSVNPDGSVIGDVGLSETNYEDGKVDVTSKTISGRVTNDRLLLVAHGNDIGAINYPLNGEKDGSGIVIRAPGAAGSLKLARSDQQDYEKRVEKLAANLTANDVGLVPPD